MPDKPYRQNGSNFSLSMDRVAVAGALGTIKETAFQKNWATKTILMACLTSACAAAFSKDMQMTRAEIHKSLDLLIDELEGADFAG